MAGRERRRPPRSLPSTEAGLVKTQLLDYAGVHITVYQRSCAFSLLAFNTEYKWTSSWENKACACPACTGVEGGKRLGEGNKCTRTPTLGRVVLMGPGWAAGGCPGCWGSKPGAPEPAVGTEGSIIHPLESGFPSPQTTMGGRGHIVRRNNSSPLSSCAESWNMLGLM